MRALAAGRSDPSKYLASVLGCSRRTAQRFLNSSVNVPLLRRTYAQTIADAIGISVSKLFKERPVDDGNVIAGWSNTDRIDQARLTAGKLGMTICNMARLGYSLHANFSVNHSIDGRPSTVSVEILSGMDTHLLMWKSTIDSTYTSVSYVDKNGIKLYEVKPSWALIKDTLNKIQYERKNKPTKSVRDATFKQPPRSGGRIKGSVERAEI